MQAGIPPRSKVQAGGSAALAGLLLALVAGCSAAGPPPEPERSLRPETRQPAAAAPALAGPPLPPARPEVARPKLAALPEETPAAPEPIVAESFTGLASWYGKRFHGRLTASGERYDMAALTAAHRTLPFGSRVRVTNLANGRSVVVVINDRGPFTKGRAIDLSHAAARRIGILEDGVAKVRLDVLEDTTDVAG